jgi:hypothetical protein
MSMSAPEKKEDEAPVAAGASKKPLIVIGLVALLAGAGVGLFVLPGIVHPGAAAGEAEGAEAAAADGEGGEEAAAEGEEGAAGGEHA